MVAAGELWAVQCFDTWISKFSEDTHFELLHAGDFLMIPSLTDIAAAAIARRYLRTCFTCVRLRYGVRSAIPPTIMVGWLHAEWTDFQRLWIFLDGKEDPKLEADVLEAVRT